MDYVVIKDFKDLKDGSHLYVAGDAFPHVGSVVETFKESRMADLTTDQNALGEPVVALASEVGAGTTADDEKVIDVTEEVFPKSLKGGYYELSNGEKVRGKEAAIEAEAALKAGE